MNLLFRYMKRYSGQIAAVMLMKLFATLTELLLPYILEHLIDNIVPMQDILQIFLWGTLMIICAVVTWQVSIRSNRRAVDNSHNIAYDIRKDLFERTMNLSGSQFDSYGLPSLTSRMTSDSYNVQNFSRAFQTMFVRAPITLIGGIIITMTMDPVLSGVLCCMVPALLAVVIGISLKGIPMYRNVQDSLDKVVRIMRENITGIRVVKALSKEEYESRRFDGANREMTDRDIQVGSFMAVPEPLMRLFLNIGLTAVVWIGAKRVDSGIMQPGVILAFLTYFNMIMQSIMAFNRMFTMISKASASAVRIDRVIQTETGLTAESSGAQAADDSFICFDHVNFTYHTAPLSADDGGNSSQTAEQRRAQEQCLYDISFSLKKGESLGIIGPTGCGKTTIVNLLMRFYDPDSGTVFVDGRDVRTYEKDVLHRKFGVVFQNDLVFNDTLRDNISFGRQISNADLRQAVEDAQAAEFIDSLSSGLEHKADIKGANLSGGQKQRILISRALAGRPDILVLDDSSSALDYKTDACLRKAIKEHHSGSTVIMIAQRISSIMSMNNILVLDNGHAIGFGNHEQLMETCRAYREIYAAQMGCMTGKEG